MRNLFDFDSPPVSSVAVSIPSHLRSWAEIDLAALRHNALVAREKTGARVMAIIKADAYGHGAVEVARALADQVEMFGVATLTEAQELAPLALSQPVLLLGPCLPAERPEAVARGAICTISSLGEAQAYSQLTCREIALLNFKVDTGMGRIGCWEDEAVSTLSKIARLPRVEIHSISTHLPVADEDDQFSQDQLSRFEKLIPAFCEIAPRAYIHSLNSSGVLGYSRFAHDFVRAGLMLYGSVYPATHQSLLKPVLSWKARITLVREVEAGRSVSYGRTFITPHAMRIATVPVGYADGFPRQASNHGAQVLIGGVRCAVLGRVTMDQILVDVTSLPEVSAGDEVVVIGRQGNEEILARELADEAGTISWHIFTGIGNRVTRIYLNQPLIAKK